MITRLLTLGVLVMTGMRAQAAPVLGDVAFDDLEAATKAAPRLSALGIAGLRVEIRWDQVQSAPETFDDARIVEALEAWEKAHLAITLKLWGTPDWARPRDSRSRGPSAVPEAEAWYAFCRRAREAWGEHVAAWEIWPAANRPDRFAGDPQALVTVIGVAVRAFRSADRQTRCSSPAFDVTRPFRRLWLESVLRAQGRWFQSLSLSLEGDDAAARAGPGILDERGSSFLSWQGEKDYRYRDLGIAGLAVDAGDDGSGNVAASAQRGRALAQVLNAWRQIALARWLSVVLGGRKGLPFPAQDPTEELPVWNVLRPTLVGALHNNDQEGHFPRELRRELLASAKSALESSSTERAISALRTLDVLDFDNEESTMARHALSALDEVAASQARRARDLADEGRLDEARTLMERVADGYFGLDAGNEAARALRDGFPGPAAPQKDKAPGPPEPKREYH